MSNQGPSNQTKWWLGILISAICTTAGTAVWFSAQLNSVAKAAEAKMEITVENHRTRELHVLHPSRDAFDSVRNEIGEIRRSQDKIVEAQTKQDQLLQRIAEKVGAGR